MGKKGFTLIEIIVSLALLAILSVLFLSMFLNSTRIIMTTVSTKKAEMNLRKYAEGISCSGVSGIVCSDMAEESIVIVFDNPHIDDITISGIRKRVRDEEAEISYTIFEGR